MHNSVTTAPGPATTPQPSADLNNRLKPSRHCYGSSAWSNDPMGDRSPVRSLLTSVISQTTGNASADGVQNQDPVNANAGLLSYYVPMLCLFGSGCLF